MLTFGELFNKATKFAKTLVQMGVKRGDIIGLSGRNVPEWLIADLGVQMAGGCSLCFPYQLKEENLTELLGAIGTVKLLVINLDVGEQNHSTIQNILKRNSTSDKDNSVERLGLQRVVLFNQNEKFPSLNNVQDLCSQEKEADILLPRIDPEDVAIILLSSDTTNIPKAIPHSHHTLVLMAYHTMNVYGIIKEKEILYNDIHFFWSAGYPCWISCRGGTRVTMTNALNWTSMEMPL